MSKKVNFTPEGYSSVTPYLVIKGAAEAIEFYKKVFGATEMMRMEDGSRIGHAEIKIGTAPVMLADEYPEMNILSPASVGGCPVGLMVYVENVDEVVEGAVAAGATLERPVADQFYGDRLGGIVDPFGFRWYVATHIEDLSPEEMNRRAAEAKAGGQS